MWEALGPHAPPEFQVSGKLSPSPSKKRELWKLCSLESRFLNEKAGVLVQDREGFLMKRGIKWKLAYILTLLKSFLWLRNKMPE